ncbi:hypothetical protein MMC07_002740 [Pseudocyphellaria aurata]|nr:hypothetical protein [Pseudocyphellaria aurata]
MGDNAGEPMEICPPNLPSLAQYLGKLYPGAWDYSCSTGSPLQREILWFLGGSNPPKFCWDAYERCCAGIGTIEDLRTVQIFRDPHGQVNIAVWYAEGQRWMEQLEQREHEPPIISRTVPQVNNGRGGRYSEDGHDQRGGSEVAQIKAVATIKADTREATINQVDAPKMIVKWAASEAAQTANIFIIGPETYGDNDWKNIHTGQLRYFSIAGKSGGDFERGKSNLTQGANQKLKAPNEANRSSLAQQPEAQTRRPANGNARVVNGALDTTFVAEWRDAASLM